MNYQHLLIEQPEPGIYLLAIDRPGSLNALSQTVVAELSNAFHAVSTDSAARVVLLTGNGPKAFVAGADIEAMAGMSALEARKFSLETLSLMRFMEAMAVPVIALVNGYALGGGCELALACDWIIASEKAVFGQPEVSLGVMPGFGGTQRLARAVGKGLALELTLTGRQVKADEALRIGIANQVTPADQLRERGLEQARLIAAKAPIAVALIKDLVQRGQDLDLENALRAEANAFGLVFGTEDKKEGVAAFLEKRSPKFIGR